MDAVRTAKRLGAERAIIAYRRTEEEMPARRAELHHAKAEGVEVMPLVSPLEFIAGEDGTVCAVRVQKMELGEPDDSGRRRPVPIEGAIEEIPCDVAISAIGTNANPFAKMMATSSSINGATLRPMMRVVHRIRVSGLVAILLLVPQRLF